MGRALFSQRLTDQAGNVQPYTSVLLLELDATTLLAQPLYVANTGSELLSNPLTTDSLGLVVAYADTPQRAIARIATGDTTVDTVIDIEDDPADLTSAPIPLANLAVPTSGYALVSNGSAVVGAQIVNANVASNAAISHSKLAAGTPNYILRAAGGGTIGEALLVEANVTPGTLTYASLAAGAATQRPVPVVGTTDPTTASATAVALADPLGTITTIGGDIKVEAVASFSHSASALTVFSLYARIDAGSWVLIGQSGVGAIGQRAQVTGLHRFVIGAGGHNIELGWSHNGGADGTSYGTTRRLLMTEERR